MSTGDATLVVRVEVKCALLRFRVPPDIKYHLVPKLEPDDAGPGLVVKGS